MRTRLLGKFLINLVLCLVAGLGLAITVGGPTWRAALCAIAFLVAGFLFGLPTGRYLARSEERRGSLAGAVQQPQGPEEPREWPRSLGPVIVIMTLSTELLRVGLVLWSGMTAQEAAWTALLGQTLMWLPGPIIALTIPRAHPARPGERPPGPAYVATSAGTLARDMAHWLLVAWSPLLALLTFAEQVGVSLAGEERRRYQAAAGYLLLALALALWLA
ncbi:hypothetical protein SAMN05444920_119172 [Nonomuraea solani]|uniref:Uncharacterized protein n=1 Tax=Nonomuraea solani TaxID=1144553 RepID=A0A1H6ETX4_9ACTN|nr:hypothetical protein [Nonomuraea solani]SEH01242.1 hypothetical protein SAMN05444920_119172 [Nonomuraea solani]